MEDFYDPVFRLDSRISDEQVILTLPHDIDSGTASSSSLKGPRLYLAIPAFCVNVRKSSSKLPVLSLGGVLVPPVTEGANPRPVRGVLGLLKVKKSHQNQAEIVQYS